MGNSAKRSARAIVRSERAKRVAELRIAGKTWRQIGDELDISAATALKDVEDYTRDLPAETIETLRKTLLERAEANYADAHAQRERLKTPKARLDADDKISRILERHARIGRVIQEAAPVNVTQSQTQSSGIDLSKVPPEKLAQLQDAIEAVTRSTAAPESGLSAREASEVSRSTEEPKP